MTLWEKVKAEIATLEGDFTAFEAKVKAIFEAHVSEVSSTDTPATIASTLVTAPTAPPPAVEPAVATVETGSTPAA